MTRRYWDELVDRWYAGEREPYAWLGDGGDDGAAANALYRKLLAPAGAARWRRAVELAPGAGRQTERVLVGSSAIVRAYDSNALALAACERRCRAEIAAGRLSLHALPRRRPDELLLDLRACRWEGEVDAVYSLTATFGVRELLVYLVTAAGALRRGGKLIVRLPEATRAAALETLLGEVRHAYSGNGLDDAWLGPDMLASLAPRLGFRINRLDEDGRDLHVVASRIEAPAAEELAACLRTGVEDDDYYFDLVARVRAAASAALPPGSVVAVASGGGDELVELDGARAVHFPAAPQSWHRGFNPVDGAEAAELLEAFREQGGEFLLLPASSFWWLDHYVELRQRLELCGGPVWADDHCLIYRVAG